MRIREDLLENQDDMGTSGTKTYNLDYTDSISELCLLLEATNGATSNKNNPPEVNVSKIEIVDGGQVLWDSPGDVAFATWSHLNNDMPHMYRSGAVSDSVWVPINIRFGRYLFDEMYAFNPIAHKNPQLKITFDEATIRAAGATGYVSDSFNLSIIARLMEDITPPVGFLSLREIEQFTSLASGDYPVIMPTDEKWRILVSRAYESSVHMSTTITKHRLSCDGGKFVPFDLYYRNMRDIMAQYFKPLQMPQYTVTDNLEYHQSWCGDGYYADVRAHTDTYIATAGSHSGGRIRIGQCTHAGAAVNGAAVHFSVRGLPIHNCLIYPFGRLNDPESWFDATQFRKIMYYLTNGDAGADCNVMVQSEHRY